MPIHEWKRVEAGSFHHFHHDWIMQIARALDSGILPDDHYALAEQQAAGFGPDVLTLQGTRPEADVGGSTEGPAPARNGLLLVDLFPSTKCDPNGLHAVLWEEIADELVTPPPDKPLTLAAYESGPTVHAYLEPVAAGDVLTEMPLLLEPGAHVLIPLEGTYVAAYAAMPRRWRRVMEASSLEQPT